MPSCLAWGKNQSCMTKRKFFLAQTKADTKNLQRVCPYHATPLILSGAAIPGTFCRCGHSLLVCILVVVQSVKLSKCFKSEKFRYATK